MKKQFAGGSRRRPADPRAPSARRSSPHTAPPETPSPYPAFGDVLNKTTWSSYCSAFAG